MNKRKITHQNLMFAGRFVFHHERPSFGDDVEKVRSQKGVPINAEQKETPASRVLDNNDLFRARNYTKRYAQASFWEHPDNKPRWKHLTLRHQSEYRRIPANQRESYLRKYAGEIQSRYLIDKDFFENRLAPILKVPRLRPSLIDRPELLVQKPVFALGGNISRRIAQNFRGAKASYVPGADPGTVLQNFEKQVIEGGSIDTLKGAGAIVTFDPALFGSKIPHEKYIRDTEALLTRLQELGMVVTVISPLRTGNFNFEGVPTHGKLLVPHGYSKDKLMANKRRMDYWNEMGRLKSKGLITSLVDLAGVMLSRDLQGTNNNFLSHDSGEVLNDMGIEMAVNGAIMGLNAAHGYDGGTFTNGRYWPGGEDHELGKKNIHGKLVKRVSAGTPLVGEVERKKALERVGSPDALDPLRRLATKLMGPNMLHMSHDELYGEYMKKDTRAVPGMYVFSYPAKRVVHEAFVAIQAERAAGKDVTEMTREFSKLSSLTFLKLARKAIIDARELFETAADPNDPNRYIYLPHRKAAYNHAKRYVKNAEDANAFYGFYNGNIGSLKKEWKAFEKLEPVDLWLRKS